MNYTDNVKIIEKIDQLDTSDIFQNENPDNYNLYEEFYQYFKNEVEINSAKYKISPIFFYIDNKRNCGASASFYNGNYFIKISSGYVKYMDLMLRKNIDIFQNEHLSNIYHSIKLEKNLNIQEFILESSLKFTFHHEFRHLHQCNGETFKFTENQSENKFSFERHLFEYDADLIGAWFVMDFAFETYEKLNVKSKENLTSLMYLAISSIIITYLLFYFNRMESQMIIHNPEKFYSEKNTHPHTIVRILSIIEFYKDNIETNYNLNIETVDLLKRSLEIGNLYFEQLQLNSNLNLVMEFFNIWKENITEINEYVKKLDNGIKIHLTIKKIITNYSKIQ